MQNLGQGRRKAMSQPVRQRLRKGWTSIDTPTGRGSSILEWNKQADLWQSKMCLQRKNGGIAKIQNLNCHTVISFCWGRRLEICIILPKPLFIYLFAFKIWVMHSYRPCIFNGYAALIQMSASCSLWACQRRRKWIRHRRHKQSWGVCSVLSKAWGI